MKYWKISYIIFTIVILISGCAYGNEKNTNLPDEPDSAASTDWMGDELLREETDCADLSDQWEPNPDESLYAYTAELEEIPELGRCSTSVMNIGNNYICYKDILVLGSTIYKKETERYVKQDLTLHPIFDVYVQHEEMAVDARQYKNLIIAQSEDNKSFLIYDMDTDTVYSCCSAEEGMIGPFWCVYDGCIYYSEWTWESKKERTLKKVNLLNNSVEEIYRPEKGKNNCSFGAFGIREDGAIMYEVYNGGCREYWIAEKEGNGEWNERKLWEDIWEFEYLLDVNQYGMIVMGTVDTTRDLVVIKDNGETLKLDEDSIYGTYLFTDKGYFSSNLATLEHMPWDNDDVASEWLSRYLADSVSFYDYEGNKLKTYPMISKELLEQGYYLKKLTCHEGKLTGFYVQFETEELYINQCDVDIHD